MRPGRSRARPHQALRPLAWLVFPYGSYHGTVSTGVSWSDLHFNSLHFVVGVIVLYSLIQQILITNEVTTAGTESCLQAHRVGSGREHGAMRASERTAGSRGKAFLGTRASQRMSRWGGVKERGFQTREQHIKQSGCRENLAPKGQEEARQHLRWAGAGWRLTPDKKFGSRTWCPP